VIKGYEKQAAQRGDARRIIKILEEHRDADSIVLPDGNEVEVSPSYKLLFKYIEELQEYKNEVSSLADRIDDNVNKIDRRIVKIRTQLRDDFVKFYHKEK